MTSMENDRDDEETVLQSSHREWVEDQERRQQLRDERVVLQFLRLKLKQPVTTVESHPVELVKKECFGLFDPLINGLG